MRSTLCFLQLVYVNLGNIRLARLLARLVLFIFLVEKARIIDCGV